ncbi:histidine phosphatase superfamily [Absidia repens]|uniref:Histidine phosphatase superfamily n=1 Tax=Absidia repens TaxID=90262 RepID=A0A1X2IPL9_9FUNG|nr:histidine phosphatase superfamily [Absidia repens]
MAPEISTTDTVFLVRHGERIDHVSQLWQNDPAHGISDPPLTSLGHQQAEMTGQRLGELIQQQQQQRKTMTTAAPIILVYTSPFQRCIDTSIGIIKGLGGCIDSQYPPLLRMDLGLTEWMSDQFYDEIYCSGSQFLARHQEQLARRQAMHYHQLHLQHHDSPPSPPPTSDDNDDDNDSSKKSISQPFILPPLTIDYTYHSSQYTDFSFPESYPDMLKRFDYTRQQCIVQSSFSFLPKKYQRCSSSSIYVIMVTHGIGINALLDSFRNTTTRPIKTPYCCISRFQYKRLFSASSIGGNKFLSFAKSDNDDGDDDDDDDGWLDPTSLKFEQWKWVPDLLASDSHLTL